MRGGLNPERQRADGSFPEVRLAYAEARECPKALNNGFFCAAASCSRGGHVRALPPVTPP